LTATIRTRAGGALTDRTRFPKERCRRASWRWRRRCSSRG
jgi:hypothetical protein